MNIDIDSQSLQKIQSEYESHPQIKQQLEIQYLNIIFRNRQFYEYYLKLQNKSDGYQELPLSFPTPEPIIPKDWTLHTPNTSKYASTKKKLISNKYCDDISIWNIDTLKVYTYRDSRPRIAITIKCNETHTNVFRVDAMKSHCKWCNKLNAVNLKCQMQSWPARHMNYYEKRWCLLMSIQHRINQSCVKYGKKKFKYLGFFGLRLGTEPKLQLIELECTSKGHNKVIQL